MSLAWSPSLGPLVRSPRCPLHLIRSPGLHAAPLSPSPHAFLLALQSPSPWVPHPGMVVWVPCLGSWFGSWFSPLSAPPATPCHALLLPYSWPTFLARPALLGPWPWILNWARSPCEKQSPALSLGPLVSLSPWSCTSHPDTWQWPWTWRLALQCRIPCLPSSALSTFLSPLPQPWPLALHSLA